MALYNAVLYFFIYSFLGWIYETAFVSIREKKWSNRGFLMGPICPIYGVGAVAAVLICSDRGIIATFLLCVVGSAVMEYVTAYTLEKLFHASWWDYSNVPFNVNGYICLPASIGFGLAGLLITFVIHPIISKPIDMIPDALTQVIVLVLVAVTSSDLTLTVSNLTDFDVKVKEYEESVNKAMSDKYDELESSMNSRREAFDKHHTMLTEKMKNSIVEREMSLSGARLNFTQKNAIKSIRKFKSDSEGSATRDRIRNALMKLSSKSRGKSKDGGDADSGSDSVE